MDTIPTIATTADWHAFYVDPYPGMKGSDRVVDSLFFPGARLAISCLTASQSMAIPAGRPSSTAPMEAP